MKTIISGSGTLVVRSEIPDEILAGAYPYFTAEFHFDGGLHLELSPYPEVYDEAKIRAFLASLLPYVESGFIGCAADLESDGLHVYSRICWAFHFRCGHLSREWIGTGSCSCSQVIAE